MATRILRFVSRAGHLALRERWSKGRCHRLSWTVAQKAEFLRQAEAYRHADARWKRTHGPVSGGANILLWRCSR